MYNLTQSPRNRKILFAILSFFLAIFILAGFSEALASKSAIISSSFLPLILQQASSPGAGTGTPTATGTKTATATRTVTPTKTNTPTKTIKPSPTPVVGAGNVLIVDFAFQPAEITVHIGEKVEWENKGLASHTTTSDTGVWDSGTLAPDNKFTFVFNTLGDYPYHCSFHPDMTGIIHVVPNP